MAHTIRERVAEIKSFFNSDTASDAAVALIIILVGTGAFGLGRHSASSPRHEPVRITEPKENAAPAALGVAAGGTAERGDGSVVASKAGEKYHFPWCPGASRIAEANKVYFPSAAEARQSGYEPASNCPGLE